MAVAIAIVGALALSASATSVVVTGPQQVPLGDVEAVLGLAPDAATPKALRNWAQLATDEVVAHYHELGFTQVRTWYAYRPARDAVEIHVDEGHMAHVVFRGISLTKALKYREYIVLPGDVYHARTVQQQTAELKSRFGLARISTRVEPMRALTKTPLGEFVVERQLIIEVVTPERLGWRVSVGVDSQFGVIPLVGYRDTNSLLEGDRFETSLAIALPFRQLVTQQAAKFQWVYGDLPLEYQFPGITDWLAPRVALRARMVRDSRTDLSIDQYDHATFSGEVGFAVPLGAVRAELSGGVRGDFVTGDDAAGGSIDDNTLRGVGRVEIEVVTSPRRFVNDRPDTLTLMAEVAGNAEEGTMWFLALTGRQILSDADFTLVFRERAMTRGGDVRFFEEDEISSGNYMRVFFDLYVQHALQLDTTFFIDWTTRFSTGVFYDISAYVGARDAGDAWDLAHGFGPLFKGLFFDQLYVEVGYAFGFGPDGFDHNFLLSMRTVF